jgi:putative transposase
MTDQGDEAMTTIIQETDTEISERFPIEMEEIGTDKKHMHLLCSAHPKMAPGRIMQMFKSHHGAEDLSAEACGQAGVVGRRGERENWQTVERYVQRQGQPREDLRQLRLF